MLGSATSHAGVLAIVIALAAASPPRIAHAIEPAAPTHDTERAKAELARGQQLFDEANHAEALLAFEAAYAAYPAPEFQYDIGLCHERLGHTEAAIAAFEAYLAAKPDAADRLDVRHRIAALRARLPPPPPPNEPERKVPEPVPTPTKAKTIESPPAPVDIAPVRERGLRAGAAVALALALGLGIGIGGGAGFGVPAARRDRTLDRALASDAPYGDRLTPEQARSVAREGDRLLALQLASIGVGAVLVGTGIGLLVAAKRRERSMRAPSAALAPMRGGLAIAGGFRW